ncbi:putative surface protease GP63, putative,metallopeptidase, partial [Trypanosoma grayi]|uniref:putative surface protease GP63, putative,metallopeptidase n=1 Tax=Trypanosoma grayi TaxID=71804 RepID=UPI0004F4A491
GTRVGDVCAEVRCTTTGVLVRYRGDDEWYPCPEDGVLQPRATFSSGGIVCPKYDEVCTVAPDGSSRLSKPTSPESKKKRKTKRKRVSRTSKKETQESEVTADTALPNSLDDEEEEEEKPVVDGGTEKRQREAEGTSSAEDTEQYEIKRNSDGSIAAALLMSVLFVFIATSVLMAP